MKVISQYGADSLRFYFSYNIRLNEDSKFSEDLLKESYNANLANLYGNSVSRIFKMISNLYQNKVPQLKKENFTKLEKVYWKEFEKLRKDYFKNFDQSKVIEATSCVVSNLKLLSKYIDETKPWIYKEKNAKIETILALAFDSILKISILLSPILIEGIETFFSLLNIDQPKSFDSVLSQKQIKILDSKIIYQRMK